MEASETKTSGPPTTPAKGSAETDTAHAGAALAAAHGRLLSHPVRESPPRPAAQGELKGVCARHEHARLSNFECRILRLRVEVAKLKSIDLEKHLRSGGGLFFSGPPGTGKDHLAVAMLRRAAALGFVCQWLDCQSWYSEVAGLWREQVNVDYELKKMRRPDVLCLSDPIVRGMTESQRATLARVVNDRWLARRSTWVTCNARDLKWADEQFGDRTLSRLRDGAVHVFCDWEDYRLTAGKESDD